ncbi:MAG: hypothetical protein E7306_07050 [Butyrivibrio sp.]|nr:hypothetical protein [Butyrivibrio sp.]
MYSFDVYDTLITRSVEEPRDIFRLMYDAIKENDDYQKLRRVIRSDFPEIRVASEKKAVIKKGAEVLLDDIYEELNVFYFLEKDELDKLKKLEMLTEFENSSGISENVELIEWLRKDGERIVLISDMYMPVSFFIELFEKHAPTLVDIPLYISGVVGVSKKDGLLFSYVHDKENVSYQDWTHIGDNIVSDFNVPRLYGIKTELFVPCSVNRMRNFDESSEQNQMVDNNEDIRLRSEEYQLGFNYVGAVLFGYVNWIINVALQLDIRELFFIARDGYVLKKIADIIIRNKNIDISTHYLYGSRIAWNPQKDSDTEALLAYLRQELGRTNGSFAFVDAKGTGQSVDNLARLLGTTINVFYYAILEAVADKKINTFVYEAEGGLIENFCRAPHGMTSGYIRNGDRIEPVIEQDSLSPSIMERIMDCNQGVEDYTRVILNKCTDNLPLFGISESIMKKCVSNPGRELARLIGDIPHDDNNNENLYAPYLNKKEIYRIEFERTTEPLEKYYKGCNLQYSYKRLSEEELKWVSDCKKKYLQREVPKKDKDAMRIVIYAFGIYGQELYHRTLHNAGIYVAAVVDKNHQKYQNIDIKVEGLNVLYEIEYEYVVIALLSKSQTLTVNKMLVSAGIDKDKIIGYKDFLNHYWEK